MSRHTGKADGTLDKKTKDLLELDDLLTRLEGVDLDRLDQELEDAKSVRTKLVEKLEKDPKLGFKELTKRRGPGRPRKHWRTKKKRYRNYYENVIKPQRRSYRLELLRSELGWYRYFTDVWKNHGKQCLITPEEWEAVIEPALGGSVVPAIRRYSTSEPISLENIYIRDTETQQIVFDGKEWLLRARGDIL